MPAGGALPNSIDASTPAGTASPALGDDQFRALKTFLEDLFIIPDNTNITAAGFTFEAAGLTNVILRNSAANPDAAGELQRNATNLLFYDGTAARTVAFLERSQTFDPGSQSGSADIQAVAGDLTLAAGYGSSTATSPVYGAGMMGNLISTANLTATQNNLAGVIGKWDVSGTCASVLAKAGVIGEVGDLGSSAHAAFMAVLGGDTGTNTPGAAYGVMSQNSTPASRFGFGLDLYRAAVGSYRAVVYGTAAIRLPNAEWIVGRNAADSANVNLLRLDTADTIAFGASLASPTIVTPTIASFVNATHTHQNAAGGGTLDTAALGAGTLAVARGGTNSGTALNNNRVVVSSAGALVEAAAMTNGQVVIGSTGAAPVVAALTQGTSITITNAAGAITIAGLAAASQAEAEAASSTTVVLTPGTGQYHPGVAKAWGLWTDAGAITASRNLSSITDTGVGNHTANLTTAFSAATAYTAFGSGAAASVMIACTTKGTGSTVIRGFNTSTGADADPTDWQVGWFGDQ